MTTITFHHRPSTRIAEKEGSIFMRVIHQRRSKSVTLPCKLHPHEWDSRKGRPLIPSGVCARTLHLHQIDEYLSREKNKILRIIELLQSKENYTAKDIIDSYHGSERCRWLSYFVDKLGDELRESGRGDWHRLKSQFRYQQKSGRLIYSVIS